MPRKTPRSLKRIAQATPPKPFIPKVGSRLRPATEESPDQTTTAKSTKTKEPHRFFNGASSYSEFLHKRTQQSIDSGKPHFAVGGREVYFPHAKVVLLRPSAKHTPYQAKFLVPRNFNKLDLRDYLYNLYGLRALNVTTQLLWSRWKRETARSPRYRSAQIKKMTIEMADPFVWPEPLKEDRIDSEYEVGVLKELNKYAEDTNRLGADRIKPPRAFDGLVGPYVPAAKPFTGKKIAKQMTNKMDLAAKLHARAEEEELIKKFLRL